LRRRFLHKGSGGNRIAPAQFGQKSIAQNPIGQNPIGQKTIGPWRCSPLLSRHFYYNKNMKDAPIMPDSPVVRDPLMIAGRAFRSRLIVGTGKYKSFQETARALEASGAEMVTVAVRRVNLDRNQESLLDFIDPHKYFLLPNTAGCYTAEEAVRTARLGREVGLSDWVKLEVIGDQATLYPDVQATLEATRVLVKEGFTVLPYTSDDVVFAKRLLEAGASAIMPLGAPIGSGLGIQNAANIRILREVITGVPLIVDAGVGTASDAAIAMELGADAVLMNTGIAGAQDPVLMAEAMKHAVLAGREAYLAGRMARKLYATASSPLEGAVR
jgi:thiazole synthase